jgi:hypothetical protein
VSRPSLPTAAREKRRDENGEQCNADDQEGDREAGRQNGQNDRRDDAEPDIDPCDAPSPSGSLAASAQFAAGPSARSDCGPP